MPRDYYEILGVPRDASEAAIKKAYRELARKYHPDRNPGDKNAESQFKEVQEAYSILGDKQKKAQYDQFGHGGPQFGGRGGPGGFQFDFGGAGTDPGAFQAGDLGELFQHFARARGGAGGGPVDLDEVFGRAAGGAGRRRRGGARPQEI